MAGALTMLAVVEVSLLLNFAPVPHVCISAHHKCQWTGQSYANNLEIQYLSATLGIVLAYNLNKQS